jgi:hypothetical protein
VFFFFFFFVVIVFFLERDLENGCVDKRTLLCLFLPREKEREREKETRSVAIPSLSLSFFLNTQSRFARARNADDTTTWSGVCARIFPL